MPACTSTEKNCGAYTCTTFKGINFYSLGACKNLPLLAASVLTPDLCISTGGACLHLYRKELWCIYNYTCTTFKGINFYSLGACKNLPLLAASVLTPDLCISTGGACLHLYREELWCIYMHHIQGESYLQSMACF